VNDHAVRRLELLGRAIRALRLLDKADKAASGPKKAGFLPTEVRVAMKEVLNDWEFEKWRT